MAPAHQWPLIGAEDLSNEEQWLLWSHFLNSCDENSYLAATGEAGGREGLHRASDSGIIKKNWWSLLILGVLCGPNCGESLLDFPGTREK